MQRIQYSLKLFSLSFVFCFLIVGANPALPAENQVDAVGFVYNDANHNRVLDSGEKGIPNIRVSNGRDIVLTDAQGEYRIPIEEDMLIFVIKPTGWTPPFNQEKRPRFYYIHKPNGSPNFKYPGVPPTGPLPQSVDFPLYPQKEPTRFKTIFFGDTQVRNQQEIAYLAHEVVEELIGTDAVFGIALGDNVFDNLTYFTGLNQTIGLIGIPFYYVIGNHDCNFDSPDDTYANETFHSIYGPSYYSFDYGQVHFIVVDDIFWPENSGKSGGRYKAGLGEKQLTFIKNDLALVTKDRLVIVAMHIPLTEIAEKGELFRLLEKHPYTFSISGHDHTMEHKFLKSADGWLGESPHHHFINGTVCGSWWSGIPDELGLPNTIMADGAPNGYAMITFSGNNYAIEYKSARKPISYQMHIYAPEEITIDQATATEVNVNIFAGSEKSTVEFKLGNKGNWVPMEKTIIQDPYFLLMKNNEPDPYPAHWRKLPKATLSQHIWKTRLPESAETGTQLIQIRTTDMFGHKYTANRVITIK
ncbi:MAG: calcineurin-like phosphoesterase family protein [bacterium]|nr:calcineurin-like phosphoesterase family protein [bacterium]